MRDIKKLLGLRIKEFRKARNMTQEQLAERIGIGMANISYIENGKFAPSADTLSKISDIFDVEPYELYMFDHLESVDVLRSELINALKTDDKVVPMMYKFWKSVK